MTRAVPALPFAAIVAAAGLLSSGCGSTAETSVAPPTAPARCQATLGVPSANFGSAGGTGSVAVTVARECSWRATSAAAWIAVTGGGEGQGEGTVTFRIAENVDPTTRRGSLSVAEQSVQLAQEAAPCRYAVAAEDTSAPANGADLAIEIRTHALCNWTVAPTAGWMSASPTSGRGDATVHIVVSANESTAPRSATVTVAGQSVTMSQQPNVATPPAPVPPPPTPPPPAPTPPPTPTPTPQPTPAPTPVPCAFQLASNSVSVAAEGGPGSVRVRTTSGCSWTASSSVGWVSVATPSGSGETDARFTVAENFSSATRSATLTIAGQTFRINQAAAQEIEFQGRMSSVTGSCPNKQFRLDNRTVTTSSATEYQHGKCSDVKNGEDATVTGFRQPDGTVAAGRVEFRK